MRFIPITIIAIPPNIIPAPMDIIIKLLVFIILTVGTNIMVSFLEKKHILDILSLIWFRVFVCISRHR